MIRQSLCAILFLVLAAGCGPSAEQQATMTAAAWTPTPPPTPTATPVPYGLTLTVQDAEGNPIPWAEAKLAGAAKPQALDLEAQLVLNDFPGPDFSASVAAQGYKPQDSSASLQRGPNEITVALDRDPAGLLPSEACASGEQLVYIEDFQDGQAQGWPEIDFQAMGWNLGESPDEPGNQLVSFSGAGHPNSSLQDMSFTDAAWRLRFRVDGRRPISFNWLNKNNFELEDQHVEDSRYQVIVDTDGTAIRRLTLPILNIGVSSGPGAKAAAWHNIEISTFQGHTEVWLDGKKSADYTDPKPLPAGTIALELLEFDSTRSDSVVSFDNLAVCSLSAPFVSLYAGK